MVVHSDHLDLDTPAIDETAEVLGCEVTAINIVLTLGITSALSRRFPKDKYVPGFCRHKFGGGLCQYVTYPQYSLSSNLVSFIPGDEYNTLWVGDGSLITNVFVGADGDMNGLSNLLTDGSFEHDVMGNWGIWGQPSVGFKSTYPVLYGQYSWSHQGIETNCGITQTVDVVNGKTYTLSVYVYCPITAGKGSGGIRLMTKIHNTYYAQYATSSYSWQRLSLTVTPHSTNNNKLTMWLGGIGTASFDGAMINEGDTANDFEYYSLETDTGFSVSGSQHNNGVFIANNYHVIGQQYVRVYTQEQLGKAGRAFVAEEAGNTVTIQLGYIDCDHTLEACRIRGNLERFGGSPGVAGGVYG